VDESNRVRKMRSHQLGLSSNRRRGRADNGDGRISRRPPPRARA
jgi:hypothetical protein